MVDWPSLHKLALDRSDAGRETLAHALIDFYVTDVSDTHNKVSDREMMLMHEIMRQLLRDAKASVRQLLARQLAQEKSVPKELILALAQDEIEIAEPVLQISELLEDVDLIDFVKRLSVEHQQAISGRQTISEQLADALIDGGDPKTIECLLQNKGAKISTAGMEKASELACVKTELQPPILTRPEISSEMAAKIYVFASEQVKSSIMSKFDIPQEKLEKCFENTIQQFLNKNSTAHAISQNQKEMVETLLKVKKVDVKLFISILRRNHVALFEYVFMRYTNLDLKFTREVIEEIGGMKLATIFKAFGVDPKDFVSLFLLARGAREGEKKVDPEEMTKALNFFSKLTTDFAQKMLAKWQSECNRMAG